MNPIIIPIHSFVDLITNSSSEIFVSSTDATVKAAKDIINSLLKSQGITSSADDLFNISLIYNARDDDGNEKQFDTDEKRNAFMEENDIDDCDEYTVKWNDLSIVPKVENNADLNKCATSIQNFFATLETWDQQC